MSDRTRLIVNADDFGLTRGINGAIVELHHAGALTSATLMASGPAFDDAVIRAWAIPRLGIGCHVVLTDGIPVSPLASIPTLLGPDRRSFRPSLNKFFADVLLGRVDRADIEREATAQIQRLQQKMIQVTHLDTHKHTHVLPAVAGAVLRAAERTGVRAIRNPFECNWSLRIGQPPSLRLLTVAVTRLFRRSFLAQPAIRDGRVRTTDGTLGISATGRLDEPTLRRLLAALPPGTWELVCHPGYNNSDLDQVKTRLRHTREIERKALFTVLTEDTRPTSEIARPHLPRPELIHYGEL